MPRFFRLANAGISSLSVDGIEHTVNEDGLLVVHVVTLNLMRELTGHFAAVEWSEEIENRAEQAQEQIERDEAEKQALFAKLDAHFGRPLDRRRSLKQLRKLWADVAARPTGQPSLQVVTAS